jgi:hypothetical protein
MRPLETAIPDQAERLSRRPAARPTPPALDAVPLAETRPLPTLMRVGTMPTWIHGGRSCRAGSSTCWWLWR